MEFMKKSKRYENSTNKVKIFDCVILLMQGFTDADFDIMDEITAFLDTIFKIWIEFNIA